MATKFNMIRDINGFNGFGLQFSDTNSKVELAINTATSLTVPGSMGMGSNGISATSQWIAIFQYDPGSTVWVANNTTASLPATSSFVSTLSQMLPTARLVSGGDVLSFISAQTAEVGVSFYAIS